MANIIYFWYDHGVLRKTGEADAVQAAIKRKDFATFDKIRRKYPERNDVVFFPEYAVQFCASGKTRKINITTQAGFERITSSEYENG